MKALLKQTGKAICYIGLFAGMQVLAALIFTVHFSNDMAMREAAGEWISEAELNQLWETFFFENIGWIAVVYGLLTLFFVWFIFAIQKKKVLKEVNMAAFSPKKLFPIILLAISAVLAVQCAFSLLPIPEGVMLEYEESIADTMGGSFLSMIISTVIMAPLVEEVIFRGLVLSRLRKVMPTTVAVIISSIVFGLFHGQILWICYATLLGVLMSFIALNCKSILASILFHFIFNFLGTFPVFALFLEDSQMAYVLVQVFSLAAAAIAIFWMIKQESRKEVIIGFAKPEKEEEADIQAS